MRGHEAIIAMRQRRQAPSAVFVDDFGVDVNWHLYAGTFPNVEILASERVELLDLRWAVGLVLHIGVDGVVRANELYKAFLKANPKRIICCAVDRKTNGYGYPTPEIIEIKDTDGTMRWPR